MGSYAVYIYASVGIVVGLLAQQSWQAIHSFRRTREEIIASYDEH